jgi:hypothetical protein
LTKLQSHPTQKMLSLQVKLLLTVSAAIAPRIPMLRNPRLRCCQWIVHVSAFCWSNSLTSASLV